MKIRVYQHTSTDLNLLREINASEAPYETICGEEISAVSFSDCFVHVYLKCPENFVDRVCAIVDGAR